MASSDGDHAPPPPPPPLQNANLQNIASSSSSPPPRPPSRDAPSAPPFHSTTKTKYHKLIYHHLVSNFLTILLVPYAAILLRKALSATPDDLHRLHQTLHDNPEAILLSAASLILLLTFYLTTRPRSVYLVDYACFRAPDELRAPMVDLMKHLVLSGLFDESSLDFHRKILARSGIGNDTCLPPSMHLIPPEPSMQAARLEGEMVMFGALDKLFASTSTNPKDVDVLIVNSSLFNPTPSLSAMIVNKYKMRSNIRSFNLGGMGCSAGVLSVDLAKDLLQVHRSSLAVVVSTELMTTSWYAGNDKSMLLPNCLFRMGAAAVLLSNRRSDRGRSKYKLRHVVRTHLGADDRAYGCVYQTEDSEGKIGVSLKRELMDVARDALTANMTRLGPLVLPLSEQLLFLVAFLSRRLLGRRRVDPYVPNFRTAFEHLCMHAGGRKVIDSLERNLGLTPKDVEATRLALHRFGNTSSSTIWYELAYSEAKGRVGKGDRVWQVAFGSGFKCNSAVWVALRKVKPTEGCNPWMDCIDRYPVKIVDHVL